MRRYLLDTNILSQIIKHPQCAIAEKIADQRNYLTG
jgi:predicted nucleic acid-binding protein